MQKQRDIGRQGFAEMLKFHEQIVGELLEENGVTVMAAGLGLPKVFAALI